MLIIGQRAFLRGRHGLSLAAFRAGGNRRMAGQPQFFECMRQREIFGRPGFHDFYEPRKATSVGMVAKRTLV